MEVLLDIERAKGGDKEAFSRVIESYKRKLYIIARSRIDNLQDIEDIMQDTIMYAYIGIKKLKDTKKFNAWITSILINTCNKMYLSRKINTLSYEEIKADNININNNEFKELEDEISFFDIINFLELEDRTIITMFYLHEYTTKEMSEILKINESTLRSRISSIRRNIKMNLERRKTNDR